MSEIDLSVCLIVKNEEQNLPTLLASLRALPCELVVVDTGSTDRSVALCEEAGAKVIRAEWGNDFAAARNVGLDQATGRWIVWFDADDKLPPEAAARISALARRAPDRAFSFVVKNSREVSQDGTSFSQVRMFPNQPRLRFVGQVHEQMYPALAAARIPVEETDVLVLHTGYATPEQRLQKQIRNREILRASVEQGGDHAMKWYQLAAADGAIGDHAQAEAGFRRCLALLAAGDPDQHLRSVVPACLAVAVEAQRGPSEALAALLEHASPNVSEWHPSQVVLAARLLDKVHGGDAALELWEKAFDPVTRPTLLPANTAETTREALQWLATYWKDRDERVAVALLRALKGYLQGIRLTRRSLPELYLAHQLPFRAVELFAWGIELDEGEAMNWVGLVKSLQAAGNPAAADYLAAARERFPGHPALAAL